MRTLSRTGLAALLVAGATITAARAVDPKHLPSDTEIVFSINLKQIFDSELFKTNKEAVEQGKAALENQAGDNPAMKYLQDAGFDLFRDLQSLTLASSGGKEATTIIIEGTFNVAKFKASAEKAAQENEHALKISKSGDHTIYEITPPDGKKGFATLLGGKVLYATTTRQGLTDALARLAGTAKAELKKEFAVLLDTVNDKQSVNFVATGPALGKLLEGAPVPNAEAAAAMFQNIDGMSGAITVAKDVQFQLGVNAKDEAGAQKMAQDGTGMLLAVQFLAGQQAKKDEKLAPVLDIVKTLRITNQGSNVLLRGNVSLDVIEKLLKTVPQ